MLHRPAFYRPLSRPAKPTGLGPFPSPALLPHGGVLPLKPSSVPPVRSCPLTLSPNEVRRSWWSSRHPPHALSNHALGLEGSTTGPEHPQPKAVLSSFRLPRLLPVPPASVLRGVSRDLPVLTPQRRDGVTAHLFIRLPALRSANPGNSPGVSRLMKHCTPGKHARYPLPALDGAAESARPSAARRLCSIWGRRRQTRSVRSWRRRRPHTLSRSPLGAGQMVVPTAVSENEDTPIPGSKLGLLARCAVPERPGQ